MRVSTLRRLTGDGGVGHEEVRLGRDAVRLVLRVRVSLHSVVQLAPPTRLKRKPVFTNVLRASTRSHRAKNALTLAYVWRYKTHSRQASICVSFARISNTNETQTSDLYF